LQFFNWHFSLNLQPNSLFPLKVFLKEKKKSLLQLLNGEGETTLDGRTSNGLLWYNFGPLGGNLVAT